LAGGILSGKYNDGNIPADSRYGTNAFVKEYAWPRYMSAEKMPNTLRILKGLAEIAKEIGCTQS